MLRLSRSLATKRSSSRRCRRRVDHSRSDDDFCVAEEKHLAINIPNEEFICPPNFYEERLERLKEAITATFLGKQNPYSQMTLCQDAKILFAHGMGEKLIEDLEPDIEILFKNERSGTPVDESLLSKLLKMFTTLGIYSKKIEELFLECSSEFYRNDIAKRLLLGKSASTNDAKNMVSKLKKEYGMPFTSKFEGMVEDIELSKDINESFKQSHQARTELPIGMEMSVNVLKTSHWPAYPPTDVKLPPEFTTYQGIFDARYGSKYRDTQLTWHNSLGMCVFEADFHNGKKELAVSPFQAVVLMLFNEAEKLSFQAIKDLTRIEDEELRKTLQSLACGESCVLLKEPEGKDVNDEDVFQINKS